MSRSFEKILEKNWPSLSKGQNEDEGDEGDEGERPIPYSLLDLSRKGSGSLAPPFPNRYFCRGLLQITGIGDN